VCGDLKKDNPLDPGSASYVKTIISSGLTADALVTDTSITITMDNPENLSAYHYQLDNGTWQQVTGNVITLNWLDEGAHTFSVRMENKDGVVDDSVLVVPFTVDAVHGPALMVKPRHIAVAPLAQFTVQVMLEELELTDSLIGAQLKLRCDRTRVRVLRVERQPFLAPAGVTAQFADSTLTDSTARYLYRNISETSLKTGTGALVNVVCQSLAAGTTTLTFVTDSTKVFTQQFRGTSSANDKTVGYYRGVVEIR
jgi:hypothetical protein